MTRLMLSDFRCYSALRLDAADSPVVLTGPTGAGKTNLLEALSFLVPGRGLRGARLSDIGRRPPQVGALDPAERPWAVAARIESPEGSTDIGTGVAAPSDRRGGNPRRTVRIDGANAAGPAALGAHVRALWLTPDMDRLFQE
ncbi:MAG: AAA family ATPase, partial [Alphaproteobacteria bacterium]